MPSHDPSRDSIEATLDEAWQALGEGRAEELLVLLASVEDAAHAHTDLAGEFTLLAVEARLGLFDLAGAKAALAETRAAEDDPSLLQAHGELALSTWKLDSAQQAFEQLARTATTDALVQAAHERLALLADLAGDDQQADALLAVARGEGAPRLTPNEFETIVETAADSLPPAFRMLFERVPVIIDPVPGIDLALGSGRDPLEVPPDLLGLFIGAPETDSVQTGEIPAHIRLFQRNLERVSEDREHLIEEIQKTLFHELGHVLGHDEDGVDALGLR